MKCFELEFSMKMYRIGPPDGEDDLRSIPSVRKDFLMLATIFAALVPLYWTCVLGNDNVPVVETCLGRIVGSTTVVKGVTVNQFLGVPYAKAPTGELRFKKPEPQEAWTEPLLATNEPPACIQYTQNPFPWYDDQPGKSEDCLFLNIWSPLHSGPGNKKAVLFWVFGGGFFIGSIRQKFHQGDALSALGDIIVVTVSYRLGSFGFLYTASDDAPGNVGIWDILAGLQWVNDHIESFGGDVSRITIAGVSAGSIAVGLLAVSPLASGLYARQIMQSGSPAYTIADNSTQSLVRSQEVASIVGCANSTFTILDSPKEIIECLRSVDAMELIIAEASLIPHSSRSFLPHYGDDILPYNAREAIIEGNFQNNDVLIGNTKDEGSFQITTSNPYIFGFFGQEEPHVNKSTAAAILRKIFARFPAVEGVISHYLPESLTEDDISGATYQLYTASGDFTLLCPTVFTAEKFAENGNKVYFYLWSHTPTTSPWAGWMGVPHFTDIEFLFGLPIKDPESYRDGETRLSMDLIHMWSNFVKHGKPMKRWPLYSKESPEFLHIGLGPEWNGTGPHRENCDFFRQYFGF